jgi:hypothetical protein
MTMTQSAGIYLRRKKKVVYGGRGGDEIKGQG